MRRALFALSAALLVVLVGGLAAMASSLRPRMIEVFEGVAIRIDGTLLQSEQAPFIHEGRTYLPLRAVAEALGARVGYDSASNTVLLTSPQVASDTDPTTVAAQVDTAIALQRIREATAKYLDVEVARRDGFNQASGMLPNHGIHFSNLRNFLSSIDLERPAGLVYVEKEGKWTLVAVEYTAILQPSKPLLPGGQWIRHGAACHYKDGNEILESNLLNCPRNHPRTNSPYDSWHPSVWTFHVWAWYPNSKGLYAAENPLLIPYNVPGVDVDHHHHD